MYNGRDISEAMKDAAKRIKRPDPFKYDVVIDPEGQWKYPGQITKIPSGDITMKGVNYPVLGVDNLGNKQMMMPGGEYTFPGQYVTEYPQMNHGGDPSIPYLNQAQDGDAGMRGMMKARMAYANEFGNPAARRMTGMVGDEYTFKGDETPWDNPTPAGMKGTHYLGSFGDEARPGIQMINGKMTFVQNPKRGSAENIKFDRDQDAEYFAEHYKEIAPRMNSWEKKDGGWLEEYATGGPTPEKARAMLEDGTVYGHPLSSKQVSLFRSILEDAGEEIQEEFRRGGTPKTLNRHKTSRNLKTSINYLMARNYNLYGLSGARFYDPNSKFEDGGWLEQYQDKGQVMTAAATTAATPVSTQAPINPTNKTGWDWVAEKWKNRDPSSNNLLMPDKYGNYVDSGVDPFDLFLSAPNVITKGVKALKGLPKGANNPKVPKFKNDPASGTYPISFNAEEAINNPYVQYVVHPDDYPKAANWKQLGTEEAMRQDLNIYNPRRGTQDVDYLPRLLGLGEFSKNKFGGQQTGWLDNYK